MVCQGYESPPKRLSVSPRKSQSRGTHWLRMSQRHTLSSQVDAGREFWICVDVTDKDTYW